jgi:colanic acid/amylovoran biosynthesis glycosyltransferase
MKIGFFLTEFPTLSETFILNQITDLIDRNEDVFVFSKFKGNFKNIHEEVGKYKLLEKTYFAIFSNNKFFLLFKAFSFFPFVFFKNKKLFNVFKIKGLLRKERLELFLRGVDLLKNKRELIVACFGPNGRDAAFLKQTGAFDFKLVVFFYGYDLTKMEKEFNLKNYYREVFSQVFLLLPICDFFKNKLIKLGANKKKIKVHHLAIKADKFKFNFKKPAKVLKILTVARLVEKKGIEYSLKALSNLNLNFEYRIVGEGEEKKRLEKLVLELNLNKRVKFLGAKNSKEVKELFSRADIFLLNSITGKDNNMEGTPTSLLEAMASGVFVITSKHSGIPEFVKHKQTGFLTKEKDTRKIRQGILFFVKEKEETKKILKNARVEVEKNFDIKKLNKKFLKYFENE